MPPVDVPSLTPNQILLLVVLMSEAREVNNNELRDLAGFALTGADNKKLEDKLGLVETDRTHRPFSHKLTEDGWKVVQALHASQPPKQGGSASRTLLTLLGNLNRALGQRKLTLKEFFKPGQDASGAPNAEARIREAYAKLAARSGDWVGLADLRDHLTDLSRAEVDEALLALLDQDGVRIIPVANSKALDTRDRAAAVKIGGEDNHALSIGRS